MFDMINYVRAWVSTKLNKNVVVVEEKEIVDEYNDIENCGDCPNVHDMKKLELLELARKQNVKVNKSDTKKVIVEKLYNSK